MGKRDGGRGERGSLPFPLFRAFLPPPLPPLFAPATHATRKWIAWSLTPGKKKENSIKNTNP